MTLHYYGFQRNFIKLSNRNAEAHRWVCDFATWKFIEISSWKRISSCTSLSDQTYVEDSSTWERFPWTSFLLLFSFADVHSLSLSSFSYVTFVSRWLLDCVFVHVITLFRKNPNSFCSRRVQDHIYVWYLFNSINLLCPRISYHVSCVPRYEQFRTSGLFSFSFSSFVIRATFRDRQDLRLQVWRVSLCQIISLAQNMFESQRWSAFHRSTHDATVRSRKREVVRESIWQHRETEIS